MKRLILYSLFTVIFSSCNAQKKLITKKMSFPTIGKHSIKIPKGTSDEKLIKGGHGGEYQYWYSDSSVVYISTDEGSATLNAERAKNKIDANAEKAIAELKNEDIEVSGKVGNQYWKEKQIHEGRVKIGYLNVNEEKKELFDNALKSFK